MAKEGSKKKDDVPPYRPGLCIAVVVLQFIGLFFMSIGSPYDVIKITSTTWLVPAGLCYSVWGTKKCGGKNAIAWHDAAFYAKCGVFEATLKAAAAFSIVSIFAFAIGILSALLLACKCLKSKIPAVLVMLFGLIVSGVPFAAIAGLYQNSTCNTRFKDIGKLQPGFAFFVVAFGMQLFSFVIMCAA